MALFSGKACPPFPNNLNEELGRDDQAGFALRIAGYDNVRILQGGFAEWKAKGGLDAASKATAAAKH